MGEPREGEGEDKEEEGKKEERNGDDGTERLAKQLELYTRSPASSRGPRIPCPISDKRTHGKGLTGKAKARERKKLNSMSNAIWTCATWEVPQRLWDAVSLSHLAKTAIGQIAGEKDGLAGSWCA
jgi:hypothetical protein